MNAQSNVARSVIGFDHDPIPFSAAKPADKVFRRDNRQDTFEGYTEHFCYDNLNRLTKSSVTGTTCSSGTNKVISYGATGSITKKSDICNTTNCMVYGGGGNAGPHALSSIVGTYNGVTNPSFTYDNNGNMLSGAGRTMSYMSFSQPSSIAQGTISAGLAYDAYHQRYKMCAPNCDIALARVITRDFVANSDALGVAPDESNVEVYRHKAKACLAALGTRAPP